MMREHIRVMCAALAALALSCAMASAASGAKTGPHFFVSGSELSGSAGVIAKSLGTTKIATAKNSIECPAASSSESSQITGGSPGTGKATLRLEGCKSGGCEVHSVGVEFPETGVISLPVNLEATFDGTEAQALAELPPLAILLRSTESNKVTIAKILKCGIQETSINAVGNNKAAGTFGAQGVAGSVLNVFKPEEESTGHEVGNVEPPTNGTYRYWDGNGKLQNVEAKLEAFAEVATLTIKLVVEVSTKPKFSIRAT